MIHFELISFLTADELARTAAGAWLGEIESANRAGKIHSVALSGGRITQKFFASVVEQNKTRTVSFATVHFFWADERCVPPTDPDSNFKLAQDLLFAPLKIAAAQIHRLRGEEAPEAALDIAEAELRRVVPSATNEQPIFDLIFLGLGEDGHVASLFQNAMSKTGKNADCNHAFEFVPNSPKPPPRRITLNYKTIIAAKQVWVLASGTGKETALKKSLDGQDRTPLGRVIGLRPGTKIFSDIAVSL